MTGDLLSLRALFSLLLVLGLLAAASWALRRGRLRLPPLRGRAEIVVETAASLGDRRSLAIVRVEGRRLLLGLTPASVSFLSELGSAPPEKPSPERRS